LQNILLPDQASRLAWLADHLPSLPGSGIVYTLTVRDAERVAEWLRLQGIEAVAYHSDSADRELLETKLLRNEIKALVATVALGMGFDKPDLGFVVHFQRPGSVVHYYQQVGRAGRAVDEAFGILLGGAEDDDIIDFFIRQAFPPEGDVLDVIEALNAASDGLSVQQIEAFVNLPFGRIERTLKLLATETPAPIRKEGARWYRSPVPYEFNAEKVQQLTAIRRREQQRMQEYMRSTECLMQFLASELDDPFAGPCGRCANCAGLVVAVDAGLEAVIAANEFLRRTRVTIEPRKRWPVDALVKDGFKGKIEPFQTEAGRALALWGDGGWAELVRRGKYDDDGNFDESLVDACAALVADWKPEPRPAWVTCVPSKRHPDLIPDFARRLAIRLGLPYRAAVVKTSDNKPQKQMENSVQQARNLDGVFAIDRHALLPGPVLLIDDITDSGWTLTVIGALLRRARCPAVFPLALADASRS
jgi:ATP-dependent DNA helicase RecQ